jgi:phospholipid/cholesterol/gamma-HCH transport system substrate-binding protein
VRNSLAGAFWRASIFLIVCLFAMFGMFAVFGQLRFQAEKVFEAVFTNVSGLEEGEFVRIAGVEVGKVKRISLRPDTTLLVTFSVDDSVVLTQGSRVVIRYDDLIGGRYLAVEEGAGGTRALTPGATIPISNTSPALDLDALIGGFRPLFRALDPGQVNALASQLISAFEGQGDTINMFFDQTALLTTSLGERDQLIGEVIVNLNTVLTSLGDKNTKFAKAVESLSQLVGTLSDRKIDLRNSIAYTNAAASSLADLLSKARPPIQKVIHETERTAGLIMSDRDYVDDLINTLPDAYKVLARQGLYGDFFGFYMCDVILKVNGTGGQPVHIKVAGQSTGRCAPK